MMVVTNYDLLCEADGNKYSGWAAGHDGSAIQRGGTRRRAGVRARALTGEAEDVKIKKHQRRLLLLWIEFQEFDFIIPYNFSLWHLWFNHKACISNPCWTFEHWAQLSKACWKGPNNSWFRFKKFFPHLLRLSQNSCSIVATGPFSTRFTATVS